MNVVRMLVVYGKWTESLDLVYNVSDNCNRIYFINTVLICLGRWEVVVGENMAFKWEKKKTQQIRLCIYCRGNKYIIHTIVYIRILRFLKVSFFYKKFYQRVVIICFGFLFFFFQLLITQWSEQKSSLVTNFVYIFVITFFLLCFFFYFYFFAVFENHPILKQFWGTFLERVIRSKLIVRLYILHISIWSNPYLKNAFLWKITENTLKCAFGWLEWQMSRKKKRK